MAEEDEFPAKTNPFTPRAPTAHQSPPQPNDDDLERAEARAARAASVRRRSSAPLSPPPAGGADKHRPFLNRAHILDLFQNCIKLASENKINQKNTWELGLIDHLSEVIRVRSSEDNDETNFQKASCTLEAGVKIYSLRVDYLHSQTYKFLAGISRAGLDHDNENVSGPDNSQTQDIVKKELDRKLSPLSTVESSYEVLNVKKFDVVFTVDPLYHQTSAQFDEGGAEGLLLNKFGVYGGCRVFIDSFDSPEKILSESQDGTADLIDLLFAKEHIEQMMINIPGKNHISPTLIDIVDQFDEDNRRSSNVFPVEQQAVPGNIDDNHHSEVDSNVFDDCGFGSIDRDDSVMNDRFTRTDANCTSHLEEYGDDTFWNRNIDSKLEKIAGFLSLGLGFTSKSNAWAGPDHWKFQKTKGLEQVPSGDNESKLPTKMVKMEKGVSDLDFTTSLKEEMPDLFASPKNKKSLLLLANRVPCNISLPEDCHYKPENLVKLLILPDVMCLGKNARKYARKSSDEARHDDDSMPCASLENENVAVDHFDIGTCNTDLEGPGCLVHTARQVNKVDIQYDKFSKSVDVHALKDVLWNNIQESIQMCEVGSEAIVSLRKVLSRDCFPVNSSPKDISPHLFFICLLHLANEHCLGLRGHSLDELDIHIPPSAHVK